MIASESVKTQVLVEPQARAKLRNLPEVLARLLSGGGEVIPVSPGRDVQIWPIRELPNKKGLASLEGQARLLHDLASIELQAMELCVRTLSEFSAAPAEFRAEVAGIAADEGRHFELCRNALDELAMPWGSFPTHIGLWQSVSCEDSLLDRIVIVHRYLEGSGLDASDTLLRRLDGVADKRARNVVKVIREEEMGHVQFGSRWYVNICRLEGLDPSLDFGPRLQKLIHKIPRRLEPISRPVRLAAGFSDPEIDVLERIRLHWLAPDPGQIHRSRSDGAVNS
jgi:uncharacterized ferritin-like protein (DUF455 family)